MKEIWVAVEGYDGYEVSNVGRVRRITKFNILKPYRRGKYLGVKLFKPKVIEKQFYVHRLVADAFLPNPTGKPQVNHKNMIHADNIVANLEWATIAENIEHYFTNN